jgi:hypothetical protein
VSSSQSYNDKDIPSHQQKKTITRLTITDHAVEHWQTLQPPMTSYMAKATMPRRSLLRGQATFVFQHRKSFTISIIEGAWVDSL